MSDKKETYNNSPTNTISMNKAVISIIISIIIACIPALVAYGGIIQKVSALQIQQDRTIQVVDALQERVNTLEKIAAGTQVALEEIKSDLHEIKLDLKELRKYNEGVLGDK